MVFYTIFFPLFIDGESYGFIRGLVQPCGRKQTRLDRCVCKSKTRSLNERVFGITRVCVFWVNNDFLTKKKGGIACIHEISIHDSEELAALGTRTPADVFRATPAFLTVHILTVVPFFFILWYRIRREGTTEPLMHYCHLPDGIFLNHDVLKYSVYRLAVPKLRPCPEFDCQLF